MKRVIYSIIVVLALNFVALALFVGVLVFGGRLDRERIEAIGSIIRDGVAKPATPEPTDSQPAPAPRASQPGPFDSLLAEHTGLPLTEQVRFMQARFDAQQAVLDRRERELLDLQRQVQLARAALASEQARFEQTRLAFEQTRAAEAQAVADAGFEDSLSLYRQMPARQVKQVFMSLDDPTVIRYLRAMEPRVAARIVREFKTPAEVERVQQLLEGMRQADQAGDSARTATAGS